MKHVWLAVLSLVAIAGTVVTGPSIAHAQGEEKIRIEAGSDKETLRRVSIDNADVRQSIRELFGVMRISFSIAPEVQGRITVELRNVGFEQALQSILKQVDATYRIEGGVYQIISRNTPEPEPYDTSWRLDIRIEEGSDPNSFNLVFAKGADVREVIRRVFKAKGIAYKIAPEVHGVATLDLRNANFDTVLQNLVQQAGAKYVLEGRIYSITPMAIAQPAAVTPPMIQLMLFAPGQTFETSLRRLIDSGINYRVEQGNYFLLDHAGQPFAQLRNLGRTEAAGTTAITVDGPYLYIVRGNSLVKVTKKDLKVVASTTLPK